jgi:hypothetical protein
MMNYKKGGKPFKFDDSKVVVDPRSETSFRGKSLLSVGTKEKFKKGKAATGYNKKEVTWY